MSATLDKERFIGMAVLTVSDTRDASNDSSGDYLAQQIQSVGHALTARSIVIDDIYKIRAIVSQWIANTDIQAILITGGTGFTSRDSTPEAVSPLFDQTIDGFGELFRQLSFAEIGTSTIQSRAIAGVANKTLIFCMPGSTGACTSAWTGIIQEQLTATHKPCNFIGSLKL